MLPPLIRFQRTTSTQDWARAWAELGAPTGLAVQALEQTAGRGRLQRTWTAPPNTSLLISVVLRPAIPLLHASRLTMLVSLAAIDACASVAGVQPQPKWPNDLLLNGRKLAGVLTELAQAEGVLVYAVIGLGLNVNTRFANTDLSATAVSLTEATDRTFAIDAVRDAYFSALMGRYERLLAGESPHAAWRQHLHPLGRRVRVAQPGLLDLRGQAVDVEPDGALVVQDDAGIRHAIWAGDVTLDEG